MDNKYPVKNFASTYLYGKGDYERPLMNAIMTCNRIDKNSAQFESIIIDVKRRQETVVLADVLMNPNVVLMINNKALPDAFSVFAAKDIKEGSKANLKIFIDCTSIIKFKNGFYVCDRVDVLIAYLMNAMTNLVYYGDTKRILTNTNLIVSATNCYVSLFSYILDYLRLNGVAENKAKLYYMVAMFFQMSVLYKQDEDTCRNIAARVAGITTREANIIDILYTVDDLKNISTFINKLNDIFKFKGFTIDVFIERWRYLFGRGTQFGPELFVAFSSIITNAYSGCYLNQQKTIEKCVGREMVTYTTTLLKIGHDALYTGRTESVQITDKYDHLKEDHHELGFDQDYMIEALFGGLPANLKMSVEDLQSASKFKAKSKQVIVYLNTNGKKDQIHKHVGQWLYGIHGNFAVNNPSKYEPKLSYLVDLMNAYSTPKEREKYNKFLQNAIDSENNLKKSGKDVRLQLAYISDAKTAIKKIK